MTEKKAPKLRFNEFRDDWKRKKLGEIGDTFNGLTGKTKDDFGSGKPFIQYMQIFNSAKIDTSKFGYVEINEDEEQKTVKYGDLFFTTSSETPLEIGYASALTEEVGEVYLNSFCFGYRPKSLNELYPDFSSFLFRSESFRKQIVRLAQGSTRYNMSKVQFMKLIIKLPSFNEQNKIAEFLSSVDKKIQLLEKKKEQLEQYKKGVMQKIFSREIRFKDENGNSFPDWRITKNHELFEERHESGKTEKVMLSVTINFGVKKFSDLNRHDNSNKNKSKYKLVKKGDLVYNTMRMWQGASGLSNYNGFVSPAYTVLKKTKNAYMPFFAYYFKHAPLIFTFRRFSQGMSSDQWAIKYNVFKKIDILIPNVFEQKKIADFLSAIDNKIDTTSTQIDKTKVFKKGLLQQMFV